MKYNTDINIIGSIPDYNLIYRALPLLISNPKEIEGFLVKNNEYDFRTEKSRKRFLAVLKSAFINHEKSELNLLVGRLIDKFSSDQQSQALLIFWVFNIQNALFFELNQSLFLNYYYQGRSDLPKDDVIAYIKDLISRTPELKGKWSEITIDTIASKYLTILKKLDLVDGILKKKFKYIHLSDEMLAIFVHIIDIVKISTSNFIENDYTQLAFVDQKSLIEKLKKVAKKDWIQMQVTGTSVAVKGKFNPNTIIDGIFG